MWHSWIQATWGSFRSMCLNRVLKNSTVFYGKINGYKCYNIERTYRLYTVQRFRSKLRHTRSRPRPIWSSNFFNFFLYSLSLKWLTTCCHLSGFFFIDTVVINAWTGHWPCPSYELPVVGATKKRVHNHVLLERK